MERIKENFNLKGWTRGFFGEWPYGDEGCMFDNGEFLNQEVIHWANISAYYPTSGVRMGDLKKSTTDE